MNKRQEVGRSRRCEGDLRESRCFTASAEGGAEGVGPGKGAHCLGIRGAHWGLEAETCHTRTAAVSPETLKPEMWVTERSVPTCSFRYYRAVKLDQGGGHIPQKVLPGHFLLSAKWPKSQVCKVNLWSLTKNLSKELQDDNN